MTGQCEQSSPARSETNREIRYDITRDATLVYLVLLLYGGLSSTQYALEYGERSYSSWRPYMAPIKIIACIGITLMLLQALALLLRDIATLRGEDLSRGDAA